MALTDIDEKSRMRNVARLEHEQDFHRRWNLIPSKQRIAIEAEINRRLDEVLSSPSPNWSSITDTSMEGAEVNPLTGVRGEWTGTVFDPIYSIACNCSEQQAGLLYGSVWKKVIIARPERWIGIRTDPTFPQRGFSLQGKSYFPDRK